MNIIEEIIDTETADGPMAVSVKYPDDGQRHPTIAVFHDGPGMRGSNHEFNRRLAGEGYRVVMPDLYHRHCLLYTSPSPRDKRQSRMPSSA